MPQPSYIQYADVSSNQTTANLQTADTLFSINHELVGGANESIQGGCNISFDAFFDIDFNLPSFDFFNSSSDFDRSLFNKIDALSTEVAMINDMLIDSIIDMECCDIASVYNSTLIPFFKFFADSEGKSVMDILITLAEVITAIKAIVEALECLMPFIPGNPWKTKDVDILSWIYGYWKESGPLLDKFFSGEYLDIIINPVHEARKQLQSCLGINDSTLIEFKNTSSIGSVSQIQKISTLAAKSGNQITRAQMLKPKPVKAPQPDDFRGRPNDYQDAVDSYKKAKLAKEKEIQNYNDVAKSIDQQTEIQKNINPNLAIATQTQYLVRASTDGLCACVADVLGIKDTSIIPIPVKTSSDMGKLIGKTINGVTNKMAGVTSKDRPAKELITVEPADIKKNSVRQAVLNAGESKGNPKKDKEGSEVKSKSCPYTAAGVPGGLGVIRETCVLIEQSTLSGAIPIQKANDEKEELAKKLRDELMNNGSKTRQSQTRHFDFWRTNQNLAKKIIDVAEHAAAGTAELKTFSPEAAHVIGEARGYTSSSLRLAKYIYENMFSTYVPFDFDSDPEDIKYTSLWLTQDLLDMMYTSFSFRGIERQEEITNLRQRAQELLPEDLKYIPFPPNTPPQNIINQLPISTSMEIDTKKEISYFDAGFVREGEPKWRNFNLLDLEYSQKMVDWGAIERDKTRSTYTAVFPNDTIGNVAQIMYLRETYPDSTINYIIKSELDIASEANIKYVTDVLYMYDTDNKIETFTDEELLEITEAIATNNGYLKGKLWVRTRPVAEDVTFMSELPEYTMGYSADIFTELNLKIDGVTRILTQEEKHLMNIAYFEILDNSDPAQRMMQINNKQLSGRARAYGVEMKQYFKEVSYHNAIDKLASSLSNSIASMVRTEIDIRIPCKCGTIICTVLNRIIQTLMSSFQKMVDQIIETITEFMIPDWLKDLAELIMEYVNCFMGLFGIPAKLASVHDEAESLRQDMKGRVRYYPADPCFIPESVHPDEAIPGQIISPEYQGYVPGPVASSNPNSTCSRPSYIRSVDAVNTVILSVLNQGPMLTNTTPPYANQFPEFNPMPLPLYLTEDVSMEPGDTGRSIPSFKLKGDYNG